jgi:hypothetical protein
MGAKTSASIEFRHRFQGNGLLAQRPTGRFFLRRQALSGKISLVDAPLDSTAGARSKFLTTRWGLVAAASAEGAAEARAALEELYRLYLALKAEALHLADRTPEAIEAIIEAEALAERFEQRGVFSRLHQLRGVFLTDMGANEMQIEASFREAIRIAKEQKSISRAKRAEATHAEYRRQKESASGGRGFRLPLL